jgi:acyl-coenzyme A thioesterase PaaI-like protein
VSAEPASGTSTPFRGEDGAAQASPQPPASAAGFFTAEGDTLVPAAFATSPWGQVLHGRLIGGLTARAAEQARAAAPELACCRLTVDLFRSVPLAPVRVTARPVRRGRRIAVLEVSIDQDGELVGQGRALLLRRSEEPEGTFRPVPAWDAPAPPQLGPPESSSNGRWSAPWESWRVDGANGGLTKGLWMRDIHPLVTGEQLTPLVRVAMAADLASPVSHFSNRGLSFINADYTVYLGREPQGEHIGIQPSGHISERGVAAGHCVVHDVHGPVGFVANAAVANPTMGGPPGGRA